MGYRIEYGTQAHAQGRSPGGFGRIVLYSMIAFVIFMLLVSHYWTEGWQIMQTIFFPWQTSAVETAAENFVQAVRAGEALSDAVMTFCADIIFNE